MVEEPKIFEELELELLGDDERGYDFITPEDLARLKDLDTEEPRVLTLYMDIREERTQHEPIGIRYRHLVEQVLETLEEADNRRLFELTAQRVGDLLAHTYGHLRGRGMAIFAVPGRATPKGGGDVEFDLFLHYHLPEPPTDTLTWGPRPALDPLLVQLDEHEPTGVVLVDRRHARFFLYYMGEVAEYNISEAEWVPQHTRALGWGAHNHMMWEETHYRQHLARVAAYTQALDRRAGWKWIVVAGPDQTPAEFLEELPKAQAEKVIGTFQLPVDGNLNQIRDRTGPIVAEAEAQEERERIEQWIGELERRGQRARAGLADTMEALQEQRIFYLITLPDFTHPGWRCGQCGALIADIMEGKPDVCPYCGGALETVPDVVGLAAARVLEWGGHVEIARQPDTQEKVRQYGYIGAILRY